MLRLQTYLMKPMSVWVLVHVVLFIHVGGVGCAVLFTHCDSKDEYYWTSELSIEEQRESRACGLDEECFMKDCTLRVFVSTLVADDNCRESSADFGSGLDKPVFIDNVKVNLLNLALSRNCLSVFRELLRFVDPYRQDAAGDTALHVAVSLKDVPLVLLILQKSNVGINKQNVWNDSALLMSAQMNCSEMFEILHKHHADVSVSNSYMYTPLHFASAYGNNLIANCILRKNTSTLNSRTISGATPLFLSAKYNHTGLSGLLMAYGAQPYIPAENGETALHLAVNSRNVDTAGRILRDFAGGVNLRDSEGNTALHLAAKMNYTQMCVLLLNHGADPYASYTTLHEAVNQKNIKIIETILNKSTKGINIQDDLGVTALLLASLSWEHKICEILLSFGADPSLSDYSNIVTPLYGASLNGDIETVKAITKFSSHLMNTPNKNGDTPLFVAVSKNHAEVVEFLVKHRADVTASKAEGWTPLHECVRNNFADIAKIILGANVTAVDIKTSRGYTPLHLSVILNVPEMFFLLVESGASLLEDVFGETPFHYSAGLGRPDFVVHLLAARRGIIDSRNWYGNTALHLAVKNNRTQIVETLLRNGASRAVTDSEGNTPLHITFQTKNTLLITNFLNISTGEDITVTNNTGVTPLILAFMYSQSVFETALEKSRGHFKPQTFLESIFPDAMKCGKLDEIKAFLEAFPGTISYTINGLTMLHYAVEYCKRDAIEYFLKKGADLSKRSFFGTTTLHIGAFNCSIELFRWLYNETEFVVDSMKDVLTQKDLFGLNPIFRAAIQGNEKVFEFLWKKYEELGFGSEELDVGSFFAVAASKGSLGIIRHLMKNAKVPADFRTIDGTTPLMYASLKGRKETFDFLLSNGAQKSAVDYYGRTLLHHAAVSEENKASGIIDTLLKSSDFDVNAVDVEGYTPLMNAVSSKNIYAIRSLLLCNADKEIENIYGESAFTLAVQSGVPEAWELLKNDDIDADALLGITLAQKDILNKTRLAYLVSRSSIADDELSYAAARGFGRQVQRMLSTASRIRPKRFQTILKEFMREYVEDMSQFGDDDPERIYEQRLSVVDLSILFSRNLFVVKRIFEETGIGCKYLVNRDEMFSPLDLAIFVNAVDQSTNPLLNYLLDRCSCCLLGRTNRLGWTLAHKAAWTGNSYALSALMSRGVDLNAPDAHGRTPLHIAAMKGYPELVKQILIRSRRTINSTDLHGFLPLHLAQIYKFPRLFDRMSKATVSMPPKVKFSFIESVSQGREKEYNKVIRLLLNYFSSLDVQDKALGWTPLHWAAMEGDVINTAILVYHGAKVNLPSWSDETPMAVARTWGRRAVYNYLKSKNGVW